MPKQLEEQLRRQGIAKGLTGERLNAYVYGTLRNTGWTPKRKTDEDYEVEVNSKMQAYGDIDEVPGKIRINPKKGDVVNTIIHEKLHANYPHMTEKEVYKNADKIESKMTLPEMAEELMEIHERSTAPQYKRMADDMVRTVCSKVRHQKIK